MSAALLAAGWAAGFLATAITYLSSRHQKVLPGPLPWRFALPGSVVSGAVAAGCFAAAISPLTTLYSLALLSMTSFSLLPIAFAFWQRWRA